MKSFKDILKEFGLKKKKNLNPAQNIADPNYKNIDNTHQAVHPGKPKTALVPHKGIDPKTGQRNLPEDIEEFDLMAFFKTIEKETE